MSPEARKMIYDAVRKIRNNAPFSDADVAIMEDAINRALAHKSATALTVRSAAEIVSHEAIVLEWYKDSEGVGTWGVGITNASGHAVDRYKDKPQSVAKCLEVYWWVLTAKYLPETLRAFGGTPLNEAQLAAAVSFHWNTGRIGSTDWVKLFREGKLRESRAFLETHYLNGGALKERRMKEAKLFFDGVWSNNGTALVIPVNKPSYTPAFGRAKRIDITADLNALGAVA